MPSCTDDQEWDLVLPLMLSCPAVPHVDDRHLMLCSAPERPSPLAGCTLSFIWVGCVCLEHLLPLELPSFVAGEILWLAIFYGPHPWERCPAQENKYHYLGGRLPCLQDIPQDREAPCVHMHFRSSFLGQLGDDDRWRIGAWPPLLQCLHRCR